MLAQDFLKQLSHILLKEEGLESSVPSSVLVAGQSTSTDEDYLTLHPSVAGSKGININLDALIFESVILDLKK